MNSRGGESASRLCTRPCSRQQPPGFNRRIATLDSLFLSGRLAIDSPADMTQWPNDTMGRRRTANYRQRQVVRGAGHQPALPTTPSVTLPNRIPSDCLSGRWRLSNPAPRASSPASAPLPQTLAQQRHASHGPFTTARPGGSLAVFRHFLSNSGPPEALVRCRCW